MMMTKVQTQDDGTKDFWVVTIKKMPLAAIWVLYK